MNKKVIAAYDKAKRVIESSTTPEHLLACRNYANNFFKSFCITQASLSGIYEVDSYTSALYETLMQAIKTKEKEYEGY